MKGKEFKKVRLKLGLTQLESGANFRFASKNVVTNIETGFRNCNETLTRSFRLTNFLPDNKSSPLIRKMVAQNAQFGRSRG